MMLIQFNKKQEKIASVTLSLFMSAWLLVMTQTCLAAIVDSNSETPVDTSGSCHDTQTDNVNDNDKSLNKEHCLGVCDCDVLTITFNSDKNSELKEKIKYSSDLYSYIQPEVIISTRAPPGSRIFTMPDRAILLPLQTYNVLLI